MGPIPTTSTKKVKPSGWAVFSFWYDEAYVVGIEGGSRFAAAKRFALRGRVKRCLKGKGRR